MSEMIMTVKTRIINSTYGESAERVIPVTFEQMTDTVNKYYEIMPRDQVEKDNSYKQIISYCLIRCGDDIFVAKRTKKQSEQRLHNLYSVGIGGHINTEDLEGENVLVQGMTRELFEEVFIDSPYTVSFYGLINDNTTEVNSVHTGACFVITLEEKKCYIRETDKHEGLWINKNDIPEYEASFEGWSRIFLNSYFGSV